MGKQTLIEGRVLSLPVYSRSKKRYVGLVDMVDMVTYVNKRFPLAGVDDMYTFLASGDRFKTIKGTR